MKIHSSLIEQKIANIMRISLKELDEAHGFVRPEGYDQFGNLPADVKTALEIQMMETVKTKTALEPS